MNLFRFMVRLCGAYVIAVMCALPLIERDPFWVARIERWICERMSTAYRCSFRVRVAQVHLLAATIELECAVVQGEDWGWYSPHIALSWSWWSLIERRQLCLSIDVYGLHATTVGSGMRVPLGEHINDLTRPVPSQFPLLVSHFRLFGAHAHGYMQDTQLHWSGICAVQSMVSGASYVHVQVDEAMVWRGETVFVNRLAAVADACIVSAKKYTVTGEGSGHSALLGLERRLIATVTGSNEGYEGVIHTDDGAAQLIITPDMFRLTAAVEKIVNVPGLSISDAHIIVTRGQDPLPISGSLVVADQLVPISGSCNLEHLMLELLPYGQVYATREGAKITGRWKEYVGLVDCSVGFQPHIRSCTITQGEKQLIELHSEDETLLQGSSERGHEKGLVAEVPLELIQQLIPGRWWEYDLILSGNASLRCVFMPRGIEIFLTLTDGSIRLPYSTVVVNGGHVRCLIDLYDRLVTIRDAQLMLSKGTISIADGICSGDPSGKISLIDIPIHLQDCLIQSQKMFFVTVNGDLRCAFDPQHGGAVRGEVIADRGYIRGNILSLQTQRDVGRAAVGWFNRFPNYALTHLDVTIRTERPVQVNTSVCKAGAQGEFHVTGTVAQPHLAGTLELLEGVLTFPYQPLHVVKGMLTVLPGRQDDPEIELIARGAIKSYDIELAISGTVKQPIIQLSSSPALKDEEVLGLLLGGTEDGSLAIALPNVVQGALERVIFGSDASASETLHQIKRFFRPLENMKLIPNLSDQSGRGGVRGALAIEVNDRLRARIQQNFSLTEDMRVEMEYALSDDTLVRGIRDERGDIGAEIEARWKF